MRKKIFGGLAILAIAAVAVLNVNLGSQKGSLSDILLANVEAVAQMEFDGGTCTTNVNTEFLLIDCGNFSLTGFQTYYSCVGNSLNFPCLAGYQAFFYDCYSLTPNEFDGVISSLCY